jgi:hypothetical protein
MKNFMFFWVFVSLLIGGLAVADQIGSSGRIAVIPDPNHYRRGEWPLSATLVTEALRGHGYQVVERANLGSILREQDLALTGRMDMTSVAQVGRLLGASHLLLVSAQANKEEKEIRTSSLRVKEYRMVVEIHARCVEVETGQTVWAGTAYGDDKVYSGGSQQRSRRHRHGDILQIVGKILGNVSYQERLDQEAMATRALREAVQALVGKLSFPPSPSPPPISEGYINLRVDSPTQVGDQFILIDQSGKEIGRVAVVRVLASGQVRAQLVSGTLTGADRAVPAIRTISVTAR